MILGLGRSPGGGHGNPLQYSCLEDPTDRGAWWATVLGVSNSRTRLKQLSTYACSTGGPALQKPLLQQCSLPRALLHGFGYLGLGGGDGRGQGYREGSTRPESSGTSLMSPHSPQGSWARAAARLSVMRGQVGIQAGSMALQERNATQKLFPLAACQACACKPPQPASDRPPEQRRASPPCPASVA